MAKRGIDISSHQGDIDLEALKDQIDFVIIRVGYGVTGVIDTKFQRNADLCVALGIPMGFYWYSYALDVSGAAVEANHFLGAISSYNPEYGCWFDMEDADGYKKRNGMPSNIELREMCQTFCRIVEDAGYYTGVYASQSWFNNQLAGPELDPYDKWVAQWPTRRGKERGLEVDSDERGDVSLWQFTSKGDFDGYNGGLDTSYAYHEFPNPKDEPGPEPTPAPEPIPTPEGSTLELVIRTQNGEFGNGDERRANLGTRYNEVQSMINHIYTADVDTLANEVIVGKYGEDDVRRAALGDRYDSVQNRVNEILRGDSADPEIYRGMRVRFTGTTSYSGIHLASWTYNDIFDVIEVSGDRVVIGKGTAVTAAVNIADCEPV